MTSEQSCYRLIDGKHGVSAPGSGADSSTLPPDVIALAISTARRSAGFFMPRLRITSLGNLVPADQPRHLDPIRRFRSSSSWQRARKAQVARQPWCSSCGSTDDLQADHRVPISTPEGWRRRLDWTNLDTLCASCNASKGSR